MSYKIDQSTECNRTGHVTAGILSLTPFLGGSIADTGVVVYINLLGILELFRSLGM